ncbi:MAG: PriCT-2 domain-containing protein, partial [Selenomonadaceae bacterium]|nr:PriCT-2 domain-containing protein [Selenomonadaceae bacterium]
MDVPHNNKGSSNLQVQNALKANDTPFGGHLVPRTFEGKEYYATADVSKIIGVTKQTVEYWRKREWLTADKRTHDGVYLYEIERVMQLASVYHPNWTRGGYEPAPFDEKQSRITELVNFFNQLYGKIPESHFVYLWTKQSGIFSFAISDETQREAMAKKAIELANSSIDIWHAVNPVYVEPTSSKRGDENSVSYQTAIIVDIDIRSAAHKGDPSFFAADFDEAKSFLPFTPSIIIHSGYGLHAYFIFDIPIKITEENREDIKRRNNLLLDVIRLRANGKKIDGVGDLPRVLRTPCTFNFKLGTENAPMCYIVENSGLRFTPDQIDEKLNALIITTAPTETQSETVRKTNIDYFDDNPDFKEFRVRRMLDFINPYTLTYDDWLAVGMTLKNIGMDCSDWEQWSRADDRFKDGECEFKWNGFNRDGYGIGTLCMFAQQGGYDA